MELHYIDHLIGMNELDDLQYETAPNTSQFLEQGVLKLRERIVCFNMGSVIIKPVQRILKYPLILSELIKVSWSLWWVSRPCHLQHQSHPAVHRRVAPG